MRAAEYHEATKHHFHQFARSSGFLDWATQPNPFRRYEGAPAIDLPRAPADGGVAYAALYEPRDPTPVDLSTIADFLRCSLGLSAWKQFQSTRWALRVNPSSGNLHPTEGYVVREDGVFHYAPADHALERRATWTTDAWRVGAGGRSGFLVGLTSVIWREAWKYGERAFRYCQHDTGHALGALRTAAAMFGWRLAILPAWPDSQLATLLGIDRDADYPDAEREDPECIVVVTPGDPSDWMTLDPALLVDAARSATWQGKANQLSPRRVDWPVIDGVVEATRYGGLGSMPSQRRSPDQLPIRTPGHLRVGSPKAVGSRELTARGVILQRRSAVAFDARSSLPRATFEAMLARLDPGAPPFDAIDWPPHVHLALFVHRVDGLIPGVYALLRDPAVQAEWHQAMHPEFLWERMAGGLFLLAPIDVKFPAMRVSCDQDIAGDGFFSLGMIARLAGLRDRGDWFYRRLFWECGLIGQQLYLDAEAAAARATGIGCFYDDPVHELLGLSGREWQSLYHFSMGVPVDDTRLTTAPGYPWEAT